MMHQISHLRHTFVTFRYKTYKTFDLDLVEIVIIALRQHI